MPYLDCAATTPIDPRVADLVMHYLSEEFGNSGSRTHDYGTRARRAVEKARDQIAASVNAGRGEVIFTSGATESNNIALLGLADHGMRTGRRHLVSTMIEHHAVLEPLESLRASGFEVTLVAPTSGGWVDPIAIREALRSDTLLVSVMHVNNETGIVQPIEEIAAILQGHPAFFHVDAAQGFGKCIPALRNRRIDLMSISGHKIHAPKGVGALIARRRAGQRPPLAPLMRGGGQELGLRPGTLPVPLVAGLGLAAALAVEECAAHTQANVRFRHKLLSALAPFGAAIAGDPNRAIPNIVNVSFPGVDAEDAIDALADVVAVSSGAACTAQSYTCSHVLGAMGLSGASASAALRFSWCHLTAEPDWDRLVKALAPLMRVGR